MSNPWVVHSAAKILPGDVHRWVLRGGAVPDAVWFGKWSHLKRMNEDGYTWRRTEFCERLAEYLRSPPTHDKGEPKP